MFAFKSLFTPFLLPYLLHHHCVVALKGDVHIHVVADLSDLVLTQEALPATALQWRWWEGSA